MRDRLIWVVLAGLLVLGCAGLAEPGSWPPANGDDEDDLPPIARLLLPDGSVAAAALGSFAYRESFADTPWLGARPLARVTAPNGAARGTVALLPGTQFVRWSAAYAAADDPQADVIAPLGAGEGEPRERVELDLPPTGEWVLQVHLTFADLDGDATYYWLVNVP
jgi:hypothetical protein